LQKQGQNDYILATIITINQRWQFQLQHCLGYLFETDLCVVSQTTEAGGTTVLVFT